MNKIDALIAAAIGEATAWYFINTLNSKFFEALILAAAKANLLWLVDLLKFFSENIKLLAIIFPILAPLALWIAWKLSKKFISIYQLAKFLLIGVLATIIDLGIFSVLIFITGISTGKPVNIFKGISFCLGTVLKYIPDKYWAFKKKGTVNIKKEFAQFFMVTAIGLAINVFIVDQIVNKMGPQFGLQPEAWANLAGIAATIAVFAWNFAGYKFFVFKK